MISSPVLNIKQQDKAGLILADPVLSSLEKDRKIEELIQSLESKDAIISDLEKRVLILEEALRLSKIKRFAPSSEQSLQYSLFDEPELESDSETPETDEPVTTPKSRKKPGRKPFSDTLPREQVFIYLTDEEKQGAIDTFFTKVKEELDIIPAKVRVLEYLQEKAVFVETADGKEQRQVKSAQMPKHPVPGAMGSIALICFVILSKFADGLPLYRLEKILSRYGGDISRATLCNWMISLANNLQPLISLMRSHQLTGKIIMADETRINVLKEPDRPPTSNKYRWVTLGGPPGEKSVLFEYDPSRSEEIPLRLLEGFSGYLQTDGYAGYNAVCRKNGITQSGCWDHARRKFKDAQKAQLKAQKDTGNQTTETDRALSLINKLYAIERSIKALSVDEKYQQRQQQSVPILNDLKIWLDENRHRIPKDSLTGKAMTYLSNQWEKLNVYCTDGELNISNILAENAVRPFVIGRKAWLFSDTPAGARASATYYSLIESAKANGLEPYSYMYKVLTALPYADTVEKLEALLPWNIKKNELSE